MPVFLGTKAYPTVPPYKGDGPSQDNDALVYELIGNRGPESPGQLRESMVSGGWEQIKTNAETYRTWLMTGNPTIFNTVGVGLKNPFGIWRTYQALDQYDWACMMPRFDPITDQASFNIWKSAAYDVFTYLGQAESLRGFEEAAPHINTLDSVIDQARILVRNVMPFYEAGIGLQFDTGVRWAYETKLSSNKTYQADLNTLLYGITRQMFGNRIGMEIVPLSDPNFNQDQWTGDGFQSATTYIRDYTSPVTWMSPESRFYIHIGTGDIALYESQSRQIFQYNIDNPGAVKHVPCYSYLDQRPGQGLNPLNLHPDTYVP